MSSLDCVIQSVNDDIEIAIMRFNKFKKICKKFGYIDSDHIIKFNYNYVTYLISVLDDIMQCV